MSDEAFKFWMVWREGSPTTRVRHALKGAAMQEAERLAKQNPCERFYVLKTIAAVVSSEPEVKHLKLTPEEIPF